MSKIPDNTVNEDLNTPKQTEPKTPKKPGRKLLWVWITGGTAIVVALALVLTQVVFPSGADVTGNLTADSPSLISPAASPSAAAEEGDPDLPPLLYKDGGDIYLVAGAESIKLDGASSYFKGEVSPDGHTLYYLANFNDHGNGDLMRIQLGNKNARPERIAEGVRSAKVSPDGKKILLFSGFYDAQALSICAPGEKPVLIAESVPDYDYGFSANGSYVYYTMYENYRQELYLYSDGVSKKIFKNPDSDKGFEVINIDESGRVLIGVGGGVYLYEGGSIRRVVEQAYNVHALCRADEFVYVTPDHDLVLYNRGNKQVISESDSGWAFAYDKRMFDYGIGGVTASGRFIFTEGSGPLTKIHTYIHTININNETASGPNPTTLEVFTDSIVYEFTVEDGKIRISNEDPGSSAPVESPAQGSIFSPDFYGMPLYYGLPLFYFADKDFRRITYNKKGALYLAVKANGQWQETKVSDYGGEAQFDGSGNYIYYFNYSYGLVEEYNAYRSSRSLYRMSLKAGETEKLFDNVIDYEIWEDECYVLSAEGGVYRINSGNDSELIQEDVKSLFAAKNGVYAYNHEDNSYNLNLSLVITDMYYISGGSSVRICGGVEQATCKGLIPPIVY